MEKFITDERTGLKYELVSDYYLIAGDDESEPEPFGVWGEHRCRYLREQKRGIYSGLLLTGKLDTHDYQAERMFSQLVKRWQNRKASLKVSKHPTKWHGSAQ